MSLIFRISLVAVICWWLVPGAPAQTPRRGQAAPKTREAEVVSAEQQAADLFEAGQNAHQAGDLPKAIQLYTDALKHDPQLWQAEFQRGIAYLSLRRYAEARTSFQSVEAQLAEAEASPEQRQISSRVQVALGEIAVAESKPDEAEKAFRHALELNPHSGRAHSELAGILMAQNKPAEAIVEGRAAIADGDERAVNYSLIGMALMAGGKPDEALSLLNEAIKRDSNAALALLYRAEIFISQNRFKEAITDLRAAVALEPLARTKLRLATVYGQLKQYPEALALCREVLSAEPSNLEARTALAATMIESGQGREAIADLEALVKAQPTRADLQAQLAELYLSTQPEKALEQYSAAAKLEPAQPAHLIGVGSALVKLRRFPEAIETLKKALGQGLKDETAYFAHTNLATAFFESENYPSAASEFIWVFNYHRNRGDQKRAAITLYFLGICFDKLGDYEQALKAYEQFLSLASSENQLEIDKVNLRMPPLQRLIKEGKGKKRQ
ncbi:MAG TPA: tetratricopeptide repeat protein [Blastocatellia bacterium]|nr:tetratricopeptide repeat protein [Blastocatellia bacterium]